MWERSKFGLPSEISGLLEPVNEVLSLLDSEIIQGKSKLQTIKNAISRDLSASEIAAQAISGLQDSFEAQFSELWSLVLHPFHDQAAEMKNGYPYLSVPNAIDFLKKKFRTDDPSIPKQRLDVLIIVCASGNYEQLSATLTALSSVFDIEGLSTAADKAKEYATLERSKMELPDSQVSPRWTKNDELPFLAKTKAVSEELFSKVDSLTSDTFDELSDLMSESSSYSSDLRARLNALIQFVSINAQSAYFDNNTLPALAEKLTPPQTHDSVLNCVACVAAPAGSGTLLKLVAGL
jgi:hypothetical protein